MKNQFYLLICFLFVVISSFTQNNKSLIFFDHFDSYDAGGYLYAQNPEDWTLWDFNPGTNDALVTDSISLSGENAVLIVDGVDLVKPLNNYTSGIFIISFFMYIPEGGSAYFNTLQEFAGANSQWGMQVYFENGIATMDAGGYGAISFNFEHETWTHHDLKLDLTNDWAKYYLNNELIYEWQWSLGVTGQGNLVQLSGSNFYSWEGTMSEPMFFIDNYKVENLYFETAPPDNFQAMIFDQNNVYLSWKGPDYYQGAPLGYNIYRNGSFIAFTEDPVYEDISMPAGTNWYFVTALFPGAESDPSDFKYIEIVDLTDDFEGYIAGEQLACQNPEEWTTWNENPCSFEDPFITDELAYSGDLSVILQDSNNLIKPIGNLNTGRYEICFRMYIPTGYEGYFGILQDLAGPGSEWGIQVNFDDNGQGYVQAGAVSQEIFSYNHDQWNSNRITIDMYEDWASYSFNDVIIKEWAWSTGLYGTNNLNRLAGLQFQSWNNGALGPFKYYIDDLSFQSQSKPELMPPTNLSATLDEDDIILSWNAPMTGCWLHYDGENFDGLGPGTMYIAARFLPEDLQELEGMYLTAIKFFAKSENCSYSLRVWTGENAGNLVLQQDVPEFDPDSWNLIELSDPISIDASEELWIGNVCTGPAWEYPAACDEGPAIINKGDLFSYDGMNWSSISIQFGFDYNWNIRGLVSENTNDKNYSEIQKFHQDKEDKGFLEYNVYTSIDDEDFYYSTSTTDTFLIFNDAGNLSDQWGFYVRACYDEGESMPSDSVYVVITGDENTKSISPVQVFPNPASEYVSIQSTDEICEIEIISLTGQKLKSIFPEQKTSVKISLEGIKPGIYLIRVKTENNPIIRKIVMK